ncbi:interleukin 17a/f1 isoform X2 [Amphiprion ocellaris]|uniref:Interleukin 17a/f1 n=1 Tax=Amphiprion ocellaris TaxID=80972 RepID=A0AAQ5ZNH9_AMPOC|nr:interleukin 17a/f1 isoform X2 [Amphiprion ocellaris]
MFSAADSSRATAVVMATMMTLMMMMPEVNAMPKASKTHRKSSDGATPETVPLKLDSNTLVLSGNIRVLANDSISPWTYNVSSDDSLFPPVLSEARCLLKGCLDRHGREDQNLESRPIMHQLMMLRRIRSTGAEPSYHYRLEFRRIAVGCTCVRHAVVEQQ